MPEQRGCKAMTTPKCFPPLLSWESEQQGEGFTGVLQMCTGVLLLGVSWAAGTATETPSPQVFQPPHLDNEGEHPNP